MTKTEERIALEAEATALGEDFAWNISDDKLRARIAEAKEQNAAQKVAGTADADEDTEGAKEVAETAQGPDRAPADDAQAPADGGAEAPVVSTSLPEGMAPALTEDGPFVTIICLRPEGRRRAGRRWAEGETVVPMRDLSDFDLAVLSADPMFRVTLPAADKA
ncbi:hypothetical protein JYP51_09430 [Ponticoccus gilvus]|nr:hypothetical protein [Enemella evansiae]